ncbi:MAG: hypothetical protein DRR19_24925 [Candidatus Parabeggiatoa sp. nov. 1]|nr:MAG: hypothetical protein DRR19_24925 [Gammaproteobacteria bacterium]
MNNQAKFLHKAIQFLHKAAGIINKTKQPKTPFISNAPFEFETVTVNERGKIIKRTAHQANQEILHLNGVTIEMVYVPGGTFLMGSPKTEKDRRFWLESPQHPVTVAPFYMGKYPITQSQWQAVMGNNPPIEWIYYDDAITFCEKLSKIMGKSYRLPSEAQWEYACRAGTTTPFYFGETMTTNLANYRGTDTQWGGSGSYRSEPKGVYREQTTKVGRFPPNAFGLYDMHGNVWEWCADPWHGKYKGAPTDGSVWETGGDSNLRVLRGGAWDLVPRSVRSASRDRLSHDTRRKTVGFRLSKLTDTIPKKG